MQQSKNFNQTNQDIKRKIRNLASKAKRQVKQVRA
jgi:hypothetical protein